MTSEPTTTMRLKTPKPMPAKSSSGRRKGRGHNKDAAEQDRDDKPLTKTWRSGDFHEIPNPRPPYNGLEISAEYEMDEGGKLSETKVTFTDYTYAANGVVVTIDPLTLGDWVDIPQSGDDTDDKPKSSVTGQVKVDCESNGKFLRVHLNYGLPPGREEIGFIFAFEQTPEE